MNQTTKTLGVKSQLAGNSPDRKLSPQRRGTMQNRSPDRNNSFSKDNGNMQKRNTFNVPKTKDSLDTNKKDVAAPIPEDREYEFIEEQAKAPVDRSNLMETDADF